MKLTEFETQSALWKQIEAELSIRLAVLREKNDGDRDPIETSKLRGQIAQIKEVLNWAKPTQNIT